MNTRLVSILILFVTCLFMHNSCMALGPGNPFPARLGAGSRQEVIDFVVTNRACTVNVILYYTNKSNQPITCGNVAITDGSIFDSYTSFKYQSMTNALALYQDSKTNMSTSTGLRYRIILAYISLGSQGMEIDTNLGLASLVTSNSFMNVLPWYIQPVIPVPNLQRFTVKVDLTATQSYTYTWTPASGGTTSLTGPGSYPNELTTTDRVVLNEWYCVATNRVRFAITVGGITNIYTQHGDLLQPPTLRMSKSKIDIMMTRGSSVTLLSKSRPDNMTAAQCVVVKQLPWSLGTNMASISIVANQPSMFYRATFE